MKYIYHEEVFDVDDVIELHSDAKILEVSFDTAANHHEYEGIEKDTIRIHWLEPVI